MPNKLKNLCLDRIDLVDKGASKDKASGEGAHVVLFKRVIVKDQPDSSDVHTPTAMGNHCAAHSQYTAGCTDCATMNKRDNGEDEHLARLLTTYHVAKAEGGEDMKKEEIEKMQAEIAKLPEPLRKYIADVEAAGVAANTKAEGMGKSMETLTAKVATLEGEVKKLTPGPTQDELMKNVPDAIKKQLEDQAKELKDNKEKLEKSEGARLQKQYTDEIEETYPALALDPAKDVDVLKAIDQHLKPEIAKRIREIFVATNATLEKSELFKEMGAGGGDGTGGSAWDRVQKMAQELVTKKESATIEQAIEKVATTHPELYKEYQEEQRSK